MINISVLGSTGSVGRQALDIIAANPDKYRLHSVSAHSNTELVKAQLRQFKPDFCVITDSSQRDKFILSEFAPTKILFGEQYLEFIASHSHVQTVLFATVGLHSLNAAIGAAKTGKRIALANKEILVAAGEIICGAVKQNPAAQLIPVDSEHSAIFQCLWGSADNESVDRLILTASGGPFRDLPAHKFADITVEDALNHPNWSMGKKITVDSATLMNKGLEVIEASWLFDMPPDRIDCVVHRQSIVHSMVQFLDGSVIAQMSYPTMEIPIALAFSYPQRIRTSVVPLDFSALTLSFEPCDRARFPCLDLAYQAAKKGSTAPAILSSANDCAVDLFLHKKIAFTDIPIVIERALAAFDTGIKLNVDSVYYIDKEVKNYIYGDVVKDLR